MTPLIFDVETTGKCDFKSPPEAPHQPRVVQLAAMLVDATGKELHSLNLMIRPDGFQIPKEASDIHGITHDMAARHGVSMQHAASLFSALVNRCDQLVAHNIDFDLLLMRGECHKATVRFPWESKQKVCTMAAMTPICKLPGNYGSYKWPKLQEAHLHAFGKEFDGAHDAMADVRACWDLLVWLNRKPEPVGAA